ncbi:TPA: PerC family transcriptional regulator [Enterobacter asburiae]|jgi:hypothetical protein
MIYDEKAEELEKKGYYRRAAARWSEVMHLCRSDFERSEARYKRDMCIKKVKKPEVKRENFGGIHRAATETQHRMGIIEPKGIFFKLRKK